MLDFLEEELSVEQNRESPLLVAVKMLREDANKNARYSKTSMSAPSPPWKRNF